MTHQFVNPLIKDHTEDTLLFTTLSLTYVLESIEHIPSEEISRDGLLGLRYCLESIRQALRFEMDRVGNISPAPRINPHLNSVETNICQVLAETLLHHASQNKTPN